MDAGRSGEDAEDFEVELRRFEAELADTRVRAYACVDRLRDVSDDLAYLFAERLPSLGSVIIPELLKIIDDPDASTSLRAVAAWAGVQVGDRGTCVSVLCEQVDQDTAWAVPAANALARNDVTTAAGHVAAALDRAEPDDATKVAQYVRALRDLGGELSEASRQRILAGCAPWVARAIEEDFPAGAGH